MSERVFNNCLSMVFGDAIKPADAATLLGAYRSPEDPGCAMCGRNAKLRARARMYLLVGIRSRRQVS